MEPGLVERDWRHDCFLSLVGGSIWPLSLRSSIRLRGRLLSIIRESLRSGPSPDQPVRGKYEHQVSSAFRQNSYRGLSWLIHTPCFSLCWFSLRHTVQAKEWGERFERSLGHMAMLVVMSVLTLDLCESKRCALRVFSRNERIAINRRRRVCPKAWRKHWSWNRLDLLALVQVSWGASTNGTT